MTKPVVLRTDLRIQHDNIIRIPRARLKQMVERFPIRVDWRDERVEIHTGPFSSRFIVSSFSLSIAYFRLIALPTLISSPAARIVPLVI